MDPAFLLVRGGEVFNPDPLGVKDLLLFGGRVVEIGDRLNLPAGLPGRVLDASGQRVSPGLIDLHVHLLGGGGEAGPASRVPEVALSALARAGITTVAGVLGTDTVTRSVESLVVKAKALAREGVSAYAYTGSYHLPAATVTGNVRSDVALIDEIVGVKVAISDHRSSQPSWQELARLASEARIGGMLGDKAGLVHVHVGDGSDRLDPILAVCEQSEIPIGQFLPTHINRSPELLEAGFEFVRRGGSIDLTAPCGSLTWPGRFTDVLRAIKEAQLPWDRVTLSSDGNGSMPKFDSQGRLVGLATGRVDALATAVRQSVETAGLSFSEMLALVTRNPSHRLGLAESKGRLAVGADADLVFWDTDLSIQTVLSLGRILISEGEIMVKGTFE